MFFNTLNKEPVICEEQQISNQLKNTYIRKKRKLKQTNLEIYFEKKKKIIYIKKYYIVIIKCHLKEKHLVY